jgi:hypothetical protein
VASFQTFPIRSTSWVDSWNWWEKWSTDMGTHILKFTTQQTNFGGLIPGIWIEVSETARCRCWVHFPFQWMGHQPSSHRRRPLTLLIRPRFESANKSQPSFLVSKTQSSHCSSRFSCIYPPQAIVGVSQSQDAQWAIRWICKDTYLGSGRTT